MTDDTAHLMGCPFTMTCCIRYDLQAEDPR